MIESKSSKGPRQFFVQHGVRKGLRRKRSPRLYSKAFKYIATHNLGGRADPGKCPSETFTLSLEFTTSLLRRNLRFSDTESRSEWTNLARTVPV
jgi:hypothetical protein